MSWTTVLWLLINLVSSVVKWAEARKAIEGAEAKRMAQILQESIHVLERVEKARADAHRKFDDAGGMSDESDPNLRD